MCKESEGCIVVTDKPSAKKCKLEPEENLYRKLIPRDGHCIANCFAVHFEEILTKFKTNWTKNFRQTYKSIDNFLNTASRKL